MDLILEVENIGGDISEPLLQANLNYVADGQIHEETLLLEAATRIVHRFSLRLPPGRPTLRVDFGEAPFHFDLDVGAANLRIVDATYAVAGDGTIDVEVVVANDGDLAADDVAAMVRLPNATAVDAQHSAGSLVIPPGTERRIVVTLPAPEGTHAIDVEVSTASPESDRSNNATSLQAEVVYRALELEYRFDDRGYWSDGSADVEVSIVAMNTGPRQYRDTISVVYTCAGPSRDDVELSGTARMQLADGFGPATESFTLRSSPGAVNCAFDTGDSDPTTMIHRVPQKIIGVDPETWDCYQDLTENRQGDYGCAGWIERHVVKWEQDTLSVWATGDRHYVDILWSALRQLEPIFGMTFTETESQQDAHLRAWMGIDEDDAPDALDADDCWEFGGCAVPDFRSDGVMTAADIGVWVIDNAWTIRSGLLDRWIEHSVLHELLHALAPMGHQDHPLSITNNLNGPEWTEIDEFHQRLLALHRDPLVEPGMTMEEVREVVVLRDEVLDPENLEASEESELTGMQLLRKAFEVLINSDTARWDIEGGWQGRTCPYEFGRASYTVSHHRQYAPDAWRFFSGSDRLYYFGWATEWLWDRETWSRQAGVWEKDDDRFSDTYFGPSYADVRPLLLSAFFFADESDIRVTTNIPGRYSIRMTLHETLNPNQRARDAILHGELSIDRESFEIVEYLMNWNLEFPGRFCERYLARASNGEYDVPFEVPDDVYEGTTDNNRALIDEIR